MMDIGRVDRARRKAEEDIRLALSELQGVLNSELEGGGVKELSVSLEVTSCQRLAPGNQVPGSVYRTVGSMPIEVSLTVNVAL